MSRRRPTPSPEPQREPRRPLDWRQLPIAGVAIALTGLLLPFWGTGLPFDEPPSPEAYAGRVGLLLLLAVAGLAAAGEEQRRSPGWWALVALCGWGALATLLPRPGPMVAPDRLPIRFEPFAVRLPVDLDAGLVELSRLALLLLTLSVAARAPRRWLLAGLAGGAVVVALRGWQEYLPQLRLGAADWRVFGGFVNPNLLAAYLVVALPVLLAVAALATDDSAPVRWLRDHQVDRAALKLRVLAIAGAVLAAGVLALTRSRGGLAGLVVAALASGLGLLRAGRPKLAGRLLLGAVLVIVAIGCGPLRSRLTAGAGMAHSKDFRVLTWSGTLNLCRDYPVFGVGLGAWPAVYPLYARAGFTQHAHSGYLQTLAESGLLGLAAHLWLLGALALAGWRALDDPRRRPLGLALMAAVSGFAVHSAVDNGWYVPAVPLVLLLLGAALGEPRSPAPARRWPLAAGAAVLLGFSGLMWLSEAARAEAKESLASGALASAREGLRRSRSWAPWRAVVYEDQAGVDGASGDLAAADQAYREALRRRPTSARANYRWAAHLAAQGLVDRAADCSARSVALGPMHLQAWLQLGRLLERANRLDEARQVYLRLDELACSPALSEADPIKDVQLEPVHAYGLMRLGDLSAAAGDVGRARDAYQRALPEFAKYVDAFRKSEAYMVDLPAEDRVRMLELRGLHASERRQVEQLVRHAEEQLARTGGSAAGP